MKHFLVLLACGALCSAALVASGQAPPNETKPVETTFLETTRAAQRIAVLADARIDESSGLAASRAFPGFLWTHNDSGDAARAFLLDGKSGATKSVVSLRGARAVDWEDCAVGTDANRVSWLYLGDIGDNKRARKNITVYRVQESDIALKKPEQSLDCQSQILKYPDGTHDAETLLVTSDERLIIISKNFSGSSIYITPEAFRANGEQTLQKLGELHFDGADFFSHLATGGDLSADNARLVVRTYTHAYEWTLAPDKNLESGWWRRAPMRWALPTSTQGEAIAYASDNRTLLTTSEKLPAPLDQIDAGEK